MASVTAGDAGNYDVVVTGACGPATSTAATLAVNNATGISSQPVGGSRCAGQSISFNVTASGTGPFNYQWRKGGVNVSGATNASYTMASVTAGDAGNYDVVVTGACGSATSTAATLAVNSATSITSQPVGGSRCAGQSITFNVTASGGGGGVPVLQIRAEGAQAVLSWISAAGEFSL